MILKSLQYLNLEGNLIDWWVAITHLASVYHFPKILYVWFQPYKRSHNSTEATSTATASANPICNDPNYDEKIIQIFSFRKSRNIKATELIAIDHKRLHYSNAKDSKFEEKQFLNQQWMENNESLIEKLEKATSIDPLNQTWHNDKMKTMIQEADAATNQSENHCKNDTTFQNLKNEFKMFVVTSHNNLKAANFS